jgi:hypothetical protein
MEQEFKREDGSEIDVYMLCPVRNATDKEKNFLEEYKKKLEEKNLIVHYPATDTKQEDLTGGYRICMDHCDEIMNSKTVHIYWNSTSTGSRVDLGSSLIEHRRRLIEHRRKRLDILLINRDFVEKIVKEQEEKGMTKSYERVLLKLDDIADSSTRIK